MVLVTATTDKTNHRRRLDEFIYIFQFDDFYDDDDAKDRRCHCFDPFTTACDNLSSGSEEDKTGKYPVISVSGESRAMLQSPML
jgi:hypothetical protein